MSYNDDRFSYANNTLSREPDGFGFYYCNVPGGQINVREEDAGTGGAKWRGYVYGEPMVRGETKIDCFRRCLIEAKKLHEIIETAA